MLTVKYPNLKCLFACVLVCMHILSKNEHSLLSWFQGSFNIPYKVCTITIFSTILQKDPLSMPIEGIVSIQSIFNRTAKQSELSASRFCSKSVSQNHILNSIIDGILCAFVEINTLLATFVVYYFQLMHRKPLIILYIMHVRWCSMCVFSNVFSF